MIEALHDRSNNVAIGSNDDKVNIGNISSPAQWLGTRLLAGRIRDDASIVLI